MFKKINIITGYDSPLEVMDIIANSFRTLKNATVCSINMAYAYLNGVYDYNLKYTKEKGDLLIQQLSELDIDYIFISDCDFMDKHHLDKMLKIDKIFFLTELYMNDFYGNVLMIGDENDCNLIEVIDNGILIDDKLMGFNEYKKIIERNLIIDDIIN